MNYDADGAKVSMESQLDVSMFVLLSTLSTLQAIVSRIVLLYSLLIFAFNEATTCYTVCTMLFIVSMSFVLTHQLAA